MLMKLSDQNTTERIATTVFLILLDFFSSFFHLVVHKIDLENLLLVFSLLFLYSLWKLDGIFIEY